MNRFFYAAAMAVALLCVASPTLAKKPIAVVKSGLLDDFGIFTAPVVRGLERQGYQVERRPWWWPEDDRRKVDLAVGHSMGGSAALTCGKKTCRRVISIDPPRANPGCRHRSNCTNYYNPFNFPGGGSVRNATNKRIGFGHLSAPRHALPQILQSTR